MNLYLEAVRRKLRFPCVKGTLDVEMLFDLPLTSKNGSDLDTIAKGVNAELKMISEESFVATTSNPRKTELQLKLELLKDIIAIKIAEAEAARKKAERAAERAKLIDVLSKKQDEQLTQLSVEEIKKRLDELDA